MVQIVEQTHDEKVEMYKKCTKLQLIEMLISCNLHLEAVTKQLHKPVVGGPASASVSEGEQLATEAVDTGVWYGERCPRCKSVNLVDVDDHWTKCQDCKFSFVGG